MKVSADEFAALFKSALGDLRTSHGLDATLPDDTLIELSLNGKHLLPFEEAAQRLFIDPSRCYRCIDLVLLPVNPPGTRYFERASAHQPTSWNDVANSGGHAPFVKTMFDV